MVTGDIFDIKRFAIHDGPGIRTTVFMRGCPLRCWWCHNPEAVASEETQKACSEKTRKRFFSSHEMRSTGEKVLPATLLEAIEKDRIFYEQSGGGVTFSGGEPLMQEDFLEEVLGACRRRGLHTALDTSGYAPWKTLEKVVGSVDIVLFDIKIVDEVLHEKFTGVSNRIIIENLAKVIETGIRTWIRVPLIPGMTDTPANIESIIALLKHYDRIDRISILPYNRIGEDKFRRFGMEFLPGPMSTQSDETLESIRDRISETGLEVVIGG